MADKQPETLDEIVAHLKATLERMGTDLKPDEDWLPILGFFGDKPAIVGVPFIGEKGLKELTCQIVIPTLITQAKPNYVALVTMGWAVEYNTKTIEGAAQQARDEAKYEPGNVEDRPNKYETLVMHVLGKDGEEVQHMAYVHRYPTSSPVLQWRDKPTQIPRDAGRFPAALRTGMKRAWEPEPTPVPAPEPIKKKKKGKKHD